MLILLGLTIPATEGWQFYKEQRRDSQLAAIPVIVMSADPHLRSQALEIKADGWLAKPVKLDVLFDLIELYGNPPGYDGHDPPAFPADAAGQRKVWNGLQLAGKQILLVEDDEIVASMIAEFLHENGCLVRRASTGEQAIKLLTRPKETLETSDDVVLLDLGLPDMSGGDVVRRLHASVQPVPPLIVMSALPGDRLQSEASSMEATAVLRKPFQVAELSSLLAAVMAPS